MDDRAGAAREQVTRTEDFMGEVTPSYTVLMGNITIMAMAKGSPERRRKTPKASLPHGDIHHPNGAKRRGEIAEAMFLTKAVTMGFSVGVLWGDSDKYDLIVDAGGRLLKVQVKSAHHPSKGPHGYFITAHAHGRRPRPYRASEIDLLVAYLVPEDAWYVFPPRAFRKRKQLRLYPHRVRKTSKYEKYREAWHWFEHVT